MPQPGSFSRRLLVPVVLAALAWEAPALVADEGMWTFQDPPLALLEQRYGFVPSEAWLEHLRLASVRFNDGGSGAFVSRDGLVLTNHHVARGQLQKMSTPRVNFAEGGFYARTRAEEVKAPDLELNVLVSMENVTDRVKAAVKPGMSDREALEARRAAMARIEKESLDRTGLRSDLVTLYQGNEYWIYRYQRYTDVRLVFAPEERVAFFGGDLDNFTYPRYDLDFAIFRVYQKGEPVTPRAFLRWNSEGAKAGDLVIVSGHPGGTERLVTLAQLEYARDVQLPTVIAYLENRLDVLRKYAARGPEAARQAQDLIFGLENSLKAYRGRLAGLRDPEIIEKKRREQQELRAKVRADPAMWERYGGAWEQIEQTMKKAGQTYEDRYYGSLPRSQAALAQLALQLVQYGAETGRPDAARLPGFHESQLESLRFGLLSPAPVYPEMDEALLASWLEEQRRVLGADDPYVKAVLAGREPEVRARETIRETRVGDPTFRQDLLEGGAEAIEASTDPLIDLARLVAPIAREQQQWAMANLEAPLAAAGERIAAARFAAYGQTVAPDANFTLRLSFGAVRSYPMNGTLAPPQTTYYGLFNRAFGFSQRPPFDLPQRFVDRRDRMDLRTPLNFVSSNDIIGGNSGSPVVNRAGEIVGVVFDGNIESLVGNYVYDEETNRAVSVHAGGIIEALRNAYDAGALADELEGGSR